MPLSLYSIMQSIYNFNFIRKLQKILSADTPYYPEIIPSVTNNIYLLTVFILDDTQSIILVLICCDTNHII